MLRVAITSIFLILPAAGNSQESLEITPEDLKVECFTQIRQLHPAQNESWWAEKCDCFAETATSKMLDFIEHTGRGETFRTWGPRRSEAYGECEIV